MTTLEVKLNLPDSLANEARQAGLLKPEELGRVSIGAGSQSVAASAVELSSQNEVLVRTGYGHTGSQTQFAR